MFERDRHDCIVTQETEDQDGFCFMVRLTLMDGGLAMYAEVPEAPEVAGNMRAIFNFPVGIFHIIVDADSGIEDFEDFKGKRVFLGPPGGSALRDGKMMMAAVGLDPETDFELVELGWGPAAQAFQDKLPTPESSFLESPRGQL